MMAYPSLIGDGTYLGLDNWECCPRPYEKAGLLNTSLHCALIATARSHYATVITLYDKHSL